jgi:hypothetical protein
MSRLPGFRILFACSFALSTAFALQTANAEQSVPIDIPGGGAADLLGVTTTPASLQDAHDDSHVHFACTDRYGRTIRQGEANYEKCVRQSGDKKAAAKASRSGTSQ